MENIYNTYCSINDYFQEVIKPEMDLIYGSDVCFYYETNIRRTYPSCLIHHFMEAGDDEKTWEYMNYIEFHISLNKDLTHIRTKMMQKFIQTIGLTSNNVYGHQQIPLYDYSDINNRVRIGCLRVSFLSNGWRNTIDNVDPTIRHTSRDLVIRYT
jgi:hypothetical protein